MEASNYFEFVIPKRRRPNFKMLAQTFGSLQTFDYSDQSVSAKCKVFLYWGIN